MRSTLRHLAGIIVLLTSALALTGCSAIKLGYNTLPDFTYWWLDGYLDLNETQTPQVRADLVKLHAWHREQELPKLADLLAKMEAMALGPVSAAQACSLVPDVRDRVMSVADQAEPAVVALVMTLTPKQIRHLERKYQSNDETWRKDWIDLPPDELKEKRYKEVVERAEMIYGSLEEPQRAVLRQGVEASIFDPKRVFADKQRRQKELLQTLRKASASGITPEEARALMRANLERSARSPDPAFQRYQEQLVDEGCRHAAAMHETMTPAQREKAARRLRAYQRDLRELAARK